MTPLGPVAAPRFINQSGYEVEHAESAGENAGKLYLRSRDFWICFHLWQCQGCVAAVVAEDVINMPPRLAPYFDHTNDLLISLATGDNFAHLLQRMWKQTTLDRTYPPAAVKLKQVMTPELSGQLDVVAIMRNKNRLVRFGVDVPASRLARLYTNMGFSPAETIRDTTIWSRQVERNGQRFSRQ